jgi:hypothetical protein
MGLQVQLFARVTEPEVEVVEQSPAQPVLCLGPDGDVFLANHLC